VLALWMGSASIPARLSRLLTVPLTWSGAFPIFAHGARRGEAFHDGDGQPGAAARRVEAKSRCRAVLNALATLAGIGQARAPRLAWRAAKSSGETPWLRASSH